VFGTGSAPARWLIVGEAPGEQEDLQGQPFVGPAGQLLDNMLKAVGLSRGGDVFITNVLKCRPPANRNPQPDEMAQCAPFLQRQIELVQPTVILALGRFAAQSLLQSSLPEVAATPLGKLRGQVHSYENNSKHVPVVVSYHPAYLLRAPADKAKAWADWCLALATAPHPH
jgi:DNA polymerase